MWFIILSIWAVGLHPGSLKHVHPKICSIDCLREGELHCEYCRMTLDDVKTLWGFESPFGACVPQPCRSFFGDTKDICQHYVHAPQNVTVHPTHNPDPQHATVVVSWTPSEYGIAFLRGFQVTLQALGGTQVACQLFLMQQNLSLTPFLSQKIFYSDIFPNLSLGTLYAVTVMALPVPEQWDRFYSKTEFRTPTCPEKNGLEKCRKDWFPTYLVVEEHGHETHVTFDLAPKYLNLTRYVLSCYSGKSRTNTKLEPDLKKNNTHCTYRFTHLFAGLNYSCEIAADVVDGIRKKFSLDIVSKTDTSSSLSDISLLASLLSLGITLVATLTAVVTAIWKRKQKKLNKYAAAGIICQDHFQQTEMKPHHKCVTQSSNPRPPCLLIVYSRNDGPNHVQVVLHLAAFLQRHMAVKVSLDLWESLSLVEEGPLGWYCRKIVESDFLLVICSRGLLGQPEQNTCLQSVEDRPNNLNISSVMVALIGEELCRVKARGQELSKYITAVFEYSQDTDVPAVLTLATHYTLPTDLSLLFSHLHGISLKQPGSSLQIECISEGFSMLPAGEALQRAILQATTCIRKQGQHQHDKFSLITHAN